MQNAEYHAARRVPGRRVKTQQSGRQAHRPYMTLLIVLVGMSFWIGQCFWVASPAFHGLTGMVLLFALISVGARVLNLYRRGRV